ncbi:MAG TPA: glycosyl hydrolase family 18 protein [Thermoleophilia bacterium]|nr:glycosyl hydrolase family 18 protein [Thermoleophilia bacterium]
MPASTDSLERRRPRPRRRRRLPALFVIIVAGLIAVAVAFVLASALDDDRRHGPYLIGAWTFGDRTSLDAAVKAGAIDEVSVDWLQSRPDGSVTAPRLDQDFIAEAKRRDCRVFVTLTDYDETRHAFDPAISAAILKTPETRRRHAEAVAAWCREYDVAGVDVDWEAVKGARRDEFSAFVEELAERLHADDRLIAVDVYPKLKEPGGWDGPRGQDWKRLGRAVDQFRVMTYNYSGSWSGPGPLSPPDWMDRVLDFAETQVAPRRIVMGLGLYGRDWLGSTTTDLTWNSVRDIRSVHEPREFRTASRELLLEYRSDGARHQAFFPDALAIRAKVRMMLSRHPHVRGVYAWLMGQEDPRSWRELARLLHAQKPARD